MYKVAIIFLDTWKAKELFFYVKSGELKFKWKSKK